jgi:hypothetical protein
MKRTKLLFYMDPGANILGTMIKNDDKTVIPIAE